MVNTSKDDVLTFWFGTKDVADFPKSLQKWWKKDASFDQEIRDLFLPLHEQAMQGDLDHWQDTPAGCLALVIVLDQFSRNMFRDTPRSFASDSRALDITFHALEKGFDACLPESGRLFLYLPLEHSEDIDNQNACVSLMRNFEEAQFLDFAIKHRDVIRRFGRFPHRNAILGRPNTADEEAFLQQPGSRF